MAPGAAKPPRTNPHTKLIASLSGLVLERQQEVDALQRTRRVLRQKAAVAQCAVAHCEALLELANALEQLRQPERRANGGGGGGGGGGAARNEQGTASGDSSGSTCAGGCCGSSSRSVEEMTRQWQDELAHMRSELAAVTAAAGGRGADSGPGSSQLSGGSGNAEAAAGGGGGGGGAHAPLLPVRWWPESPASGEAAAALDTSLPAFQSVVLESTRRFGCVLPRLRSAAPDAEACTRLLQEERSRLLGHCGVLTLRNPTALGQVMFEPLDPAVPGSAALEPPFSHWLYAVRQAELRPEQEDMICMAIDSRQARMVTIGERRARVRAQLAAAHRPAEDARLLREMAAINVVDVVLYSTTNLVIYDSIMDARQFAAFVVAAYPYVPPIEAVGDAVARLKRDREEAEARRVEGQREAGLEAHQSNSRSQPRPRPHARPGQAAADETEAPPMEAEAPQQQPQHQPQPTQPRQQPTQPRPQPAQPRPRRQPEQQPEQQPAE
ncbi:hypothetical protein Rsub_11413 [Raphidocelis subcapitata]|uniref:Uncharacterized protein n=1 Tax=Raphidocelis subcapitata TaxID=307507 RepID=A0A2V0PGM0_9CHLO|nr:hypothetical protein Rsub_11413 [Raphidocelis subcapitata]|eukprot:GBF98699.1 hypothetical protein Rsub_11413 [Raphidocelis subcapitata]